LHGQDRGGDVTAPGEAVVEGGEDGSLTRRVEAPDEGPWGRPEPAEEPLDPGREEVDPAIGETGREERHDLAVERVGVAVGKPDGIGAGPRAIVVATIERVEGALEPGRARPGHSSPQRHRGEDSTSPCPIEGALLPWERRRAVTKTSRSPTRRQGLGSP